MPEAISDSSTLIHLAGIGRLELLKEFYGKILITPTVWDEVVVEGPGRAGAGEVNGANNAGWIEGMCLAGVEKTTRLHEIMLWSNRSHTSGKSHWI